MNVLFVLPVRPGGGGVHSVVQEASEMRRLGHDARVAVAREHLPAFQRLYASRMDTDALLAPFRAPRALRRLAQSADVAVATAHSSVPMLKRLTSWNPRIAPAYYVQDYEPYFFPEGNRQRAHAARSYTDVHGMTLFAKTHWLVRTIGDRHGVEVHKVVPGIDHRIYRPAPAHAANNAGPVIVCAMVRPRTPRRGAARTMRVLRKVERTLSGAVRIRIFGVDDDDTQFRRLERRFDYGNHGALDRDGVAAALRAAEVFVDLSDYQAFGRTALEAMACGCAVIVPREGGAREYARDHDNSLIIDTRDEAAAAAAIVRLVGDAALRRHLIARGMQTAARYTVEAAARSELTVLEGARERWLSQSFFRRWLSAVA